MASILRLFSLEALDTRLWPPVDDKKRQNITNRANPVSRWGTLEFKFYYLVFLVTVPMMYIKAMESSNENNPNYPKFQHLLSDGWIFGRKVDNSDQQYRFFRGNIPMLFVIMALHSSFRHLVDLAMKNVPNVTYKRTSFDFAFGIVFLYICHGTNALRILFHFLVNYSFAKYVEDKRTALVLTWTYGIATLFVNDYFRDSQFGIALLDDSFKGLISRWDVFYNFSLLRFILFNLDYLERKQELENSKIAQSNSDPEEKEVPLTRSSEVLLSQPLDDRARLTAPLALSDYSFVHYFAYLMYAPLFIVGPVITFNDYIYQSNYGNLGRNFKRIAIYFVRLVFCILVMEFILHYMYVVAVSKAKAWQGNTPFQLSMFGLFNLNIIWLKLLIPWRMFRFWSLLDGIDPPENMIRCMDNNFSALAFWRAWHRSFNRWVIRYIYVPLGGRGKYRILTNLCVFSFVAIWHDIELKLLIWGWLVVIFLIPEIVATLVFSKYSHNWWYRHLCACGAVINIWMMMIANLYGFCLGNDGTVELIKSMTSTVGGFEFFLLSLGALFVGVQIMFELRESEKRRGIDVRC